MDQKKEIGSSLLHGRQKEIFLDKTERKRLAGRVGQKESLHQSKHVTARLHSDIKGFVFQHNSFISAAVDLFD
jgi:hypothetical protein